ncbi:transcription initiation protein SPT3 homolog isoform X1 [Penaeus japonicus]|uniref:transcription initiation protein SPT3 homolog isoform X1 n=2 Tax=Penaeus japonicus TaxID=27405 RepID=UPI001C70FA16|nr:transcription initiation protein SPT3 homolog isoform X1 [Penaeus japonicus]XP_042863254.1 transcription initiation protein SPT3 homolog isoform X1 [Penaeus japonicus]XP_042863255.1 transcription initiation protein SPT3 homolog isoform X1 [Penaeus japonicus]
MSFVTDDDSSVSDPSTPPPCSLVPDIQLMMHGFGDCRRPLLETAAVIESVVHQQMTLFLHLATDISEQRGSKVVGPEDILFIMRKDPVKLQRIVHYMGVRDLYQRARTSTSGSSVSELQELSGEGGGEISRKKICTNFLQSIDQTGQYEPLYSSSIHDPVKNERAHRLNVMTQGMSNQRYKEYCEARKASFCPRLRVNKFREWLLRDDNSEVKLSHLVLEMLNRLAYETVAQIVDLALLVKRDAMGRNSDLSRFRTPTVLNPDYPCVFIHQSGSLQEVGSGEDHSIGMDPITPAEVREAVRRYWANNSPLSPFSKTRSPIETRLLAA